MKKISGKAMKYGDNINTDLIMNNAHAAMAGPDWRAIGRYCLYNLDPTFVERVEQGDILIAGSNFGCGSSKPATISLIGAGIEAVIAKSFSRLFFRNCINSGLLPIQSESLADRINDGERLEIDPVSGYCRNLTRNWQEALPPYPPLIQELIDAGGLAKWIKGKGVERYAGLYKN
jgi:3-isopropylmalate/(R)-2-methylmalate dehydratase small subunit